MNLQVHEDFFIIIHNSKMLDLEFVCIITLSNIDCMHFLQAIFDIQILDRSLPRDIIEAKDQTDSSDSSASPTSAWQTQAVGSLNALIAGQSCSCPGWKDRRQWQVYLCTQSDLRPHCSTPSHGDPGLLHTSTGIL